MIPCTEPKINPPPPAMITRSSSRKTLNITMERELWILFFTGMELLSSLLYG